MLQSAEKIITVKGRKVQEWNPEVDAKEDILKAAIGPSGNLRAPTLRFQNTFLIGFNADVYAEQFQEA